MKEVMEITRIPDKEVISKLHMVIDDYASRLKNPTYSINVKHVGSNHNNITITIKTP